MKRSDFFYQLPDSLIAQYPPTERCSSRLLCLYGDNGQLEDRQFVDLQDLLEPGDVLVFNDTRVIPARLLGRKASGGKIEILVERILSPQRVLAHVRSNKRLKNHTELILPDDIRAKVIGKHDNLFELAFNGDTPIMEILEKYGQVPLPPYITRMPDNDDMNRYQTVYANKSGAVAAPTAGLHFDQNFIQRLEAKGITTCFVTLHVASGTFQPVRVEMIRDHLMHAEYVEVSVSVCDAVNRAKSNGKRVVAVGTTAVRSLESAWKDGQLKPLEAYTDIFIYPGIPIHSVDALITNFHLPESTLLMLVCAFSGYDNVLSAYRHAVEEKYRFFSYGDAMFITHKT